MRCQSEIEEIAEGKLMSAHLLLKHGFVDDAYYLGGYAIELFLKAMVCKTLQIDSFLKNSLKNPQAFRVHDLKQLLVLSGLYKIHNFESANPQFKTSWSAIISWDESHRYVRGKAKPEVEIFLESINAVAEWIKRHLYQN